jgi:hypothetical protein
MFRIKIFVEILKFVQITKFVQNLKYRAGGLVTLLGRARASSSLAILALGQWAWAANTGRTARLRSPEAAVCEQDHGEVPEPRGQRQQEQGLAPPLRRTRMIRSAQGSIARFLRWRRARRQGEHGGVVICFRGRPQRHLAGAATRRVRGRLEKNEDSERGRCGVREKIHPKAAAAPPAVPPQRLNDSSGVRRA